MDSFQLEPIGQNPMIFQWEKSYPQHFLAHNKHELTEVKRYDGSLLKIATDLRVTQKPEFVMPNPSDLKPVHAFSRSLGEDISKNQSYVVLTATNVMRVGYNRTIRSFRYRGKELTTMMQPNERLIAISNSAYHSNGEIFHNDGFEYLGDLTLEIHEAVKGPKHNTMSMFNEERSTKVKNTIVFHVYRKGKDSFFEDPKYYLLAPEIKEPSFHGPILVKAFKEDRLKGQIGLITKVITIKGYNGNGKGKIDKSQIWWNKNATIVTFGYAISCHKAQGNEWDNVYIDAPFLSESWNYAKWFYTAITRAKKKVELKPTRFIKILKNGNVTP